MTFITDTTAQATLKAAAVQTLVDALKALEEVRSPDEARRIANEALSKVAAAEAQIAAA